MVDVQTIGVLVTAASARDEYEAKYDLDNNPDYFTVRYSFMQKLNSLGWFVKQGTRAYTLLALLRRSLKGTIGRLGWVLDTLGGVCRWVKRQCFRRLVDWLFLKFKQQTKPETIYRRLGI